MARKFIFLLSLCSVIPIFMSSLFPLLWVSAFGELSLSLLLITMTFVLTFSVMRGGGNSIGKHLALRITLYLNGLIPWNYARFLNYCTDRLLLQRVGGRYRFIHKLLQEHFANMPLEK